MKKTSLKKGITLIAVVITIIVLLILAGISISLVTGDNGILTQSQNAATRTNKASAEEAMGMALMSLNAKFTDEQWTDNVNAKIKDWATIGMLKEELRGTGYEVTIEGNPTDSSYITGELSLDIYKSESPDNKYAFTIRPEDIYLKLVSDV